MQPSLSRGETEQINKADISTLSSDKNSNSGLLGNHQTADGVYSGFVLIRSQLCRRVPTTVGRRKRG